MSGAKNSPPQIALRFLRWICPDQLIEEIEGDLFQRFDRDVESLGIYRARRRFNINTLLYFRPGILFRNQFKPPISSVMYRNYFKVATRNLVSHKLNTIINVLGLVVGIASAIIILSIVRFEKSFDQFHSDADRIYRVVRVSQIEGQEEYRTGVAYPMPIAMNNEIASIENITRVLYWGWSSMQVDVVDDQGTSVQSFQEASGFAAIDSTFFEVFDFNNTKFKWLAGNPTKALSEPKSVVLTETVARKYFGEANPIGKSLKIDNDWDCKVTGVITDLPPNTDFPFKVMLSYSTIIQAVGDRVNNWWSVSSNECYVRLPAGVSKFEMDEQLHQLHASHTPVELHSMRKYKLQPLNEVHMDGRFGNYNERVVSKEKVTTLLIVGIFLLVTACINYVNLATAQASLRSKEIGIRKVLGGAKLQLILQFMCEAFLLTLISGVVALCIGELVILNFQELISVPTAGHLFQDVFILKALAIIVVGVTLFAGFYPAFVVSGFNPITAIRNKLTSSAAGGLQLRRILVIAQFAITQVFVIGTFVVMNQMEYFRSIDLGFDKDQIINLDIQNIDKQKLDQLKQELISIPSVDIVSFSSSIPSGVKRPKSFWDTRAKENNEDESLVTEVQAIDPEYLQLYDIRLASGRSLMISDTAGSVLINETLCKKAGYESPDAAVGREMILGDRPVTVVGVVKDFHSKSLREEIDKVVMLVNPGWVSSASIRFSLPALTGSMNPIHHILTRISNAWANVYPETPVAYQFFDQNIAAYYQEETKFSNLLQIFTAVLIFIGCLGLYGLITFVVNRRMKEVAVRKVFGATTLDIIALVSKGYVILILVAFVIAAPTSYYFGKAWLSTFAFHIDITWWVIMLPLLIVLGITFVAVCGQSIRAANANPSNLLQHE